MFDKLFLQRNTALQLVNRLEKATVKNYSPLLINFRCPICGDSHKNKFKKRGYITEKSGSLLFTCHNECGNINFEKFLKTYYDDLYQQYRFELFQQLRENNPTSKSLVEEIIEEIIEEDTSTHFSLDGLFNIRENKEAFVYIKNRKIPSIYYDDIYYTSKFYAYVNQQIPDKFDQKLVETTDPRIVLPLYDENKELFGVIGRSLNPNSELKYLTIKFKEDKPKIFGLDRFDKSEFGWFVEGPIDSYFIKNCLALAGTDGSPTQIVQDPLRFALILDNQPRSLSVLKKYEKYINLGYQVFIWPENIEHKDINDWVLSGIKYNQMMEIIKNNTFGGLKLVVKFKEWRKF